MRKDNPDQAMSFEFQGRAEVSPLNSLSNTTDQSGDYGSESEGYELKKLRGSAREIEREITDFLSESVPGARFHIKISFHYGSIEWSGIVTVLATGQTWIAAANLGGAIALAQLVGKVINSVIAHYLPQNYSTPTTSCQAVGTNVQATQNTPLVCAPISSVAEIAILGHLRSLLILTGITCGAVIAAIFYLIATNA